MIIMMIIVSFDDDDDDDHDHEHDHEHDDNCVIYFIYFDAHYVVLLILLLTLPNIDMKSLAQQPIKSWGMTENCFERTEGAAPPKLVSNKDPKEKKTRGCRVATGGSSKVWKS